MKQYLDLLREILRDGREKESARPNMPKTFGINRAMIKMDLQNGFPLLTTKQMPIKIIIYELLWFLKGDTNIKYLVDNDIKIWNGDAYRWYLKYAEQNGGEDQNGILKKNPDGTYKVFLMNEFIEEIKNGNQSTYKEYKMGDLGKIYGTQWRNQNGVDQIKDVIDNLRNNPYSRYHIIDAWNKVDFPDMALPPCHLLYQFLVNPLTDGERILIYYQGSDGATSIPHYQNENITQYLDLCNVPKFYLDLNMYQRSCDTFLGVPFNLASMSLLLLIIAKVSNMMPGIAIWIGGDVHLYLDHILLAKEQIEREPYELPHLSINKIIDTLDDILQLTVDDFELINYRSHPPIKAELFTGLKQ